MKAVFIRRFGASDVLEHGDLPTPTPKGDEVLVEVHAAGVNPRDWLIRSGRYPFRALLPPFPLILGSDVSGIVVEVGRRAGGFREGQEVYAMQPSSRGFGAYAEYVAIAAGAVAAKPANMSHEEAAGVPLAALTARQALLRNAGMRTGGRVLVIGASGGVGSYAVQIAAAHGARVTGVCSGRNVGWVGELGAGRVIDYERQSFFDASREYDVVFDTIGKESLSRCASILEPDGVYVTTIPSLRTLRQSLASRLRSILTRNRQRSSVILVRSRGRELAELTRLIEAGNLRTHVDRVFPLDRAAEAHDASRTFRTRGKIVLRVRPSPPGDATC